MHILPMNVKTTFLNWDKEEGIYIRQPEGKEMEGGGIFCRLLFCIYGFKQAPNNWSENPNGFLISLASHSVPSCYIRKKDGALIYMLTYVDDPMPFGTDL